MLQIGKENVFEREYMGKFRAFASQFGEFVSYEHDRCARDIGLHLTKKLDLGRERPSAALCWFQMKGIMSSTISEEDFKKNSEIKIPLQVNHLRYWYLQPMPTYLVLYIESTDIFLILNVQKYIREKWGNDILALKQKKVTISVPTSSILDKQAFNLILSEGDIDEWKKIIKAEIKDIKICARDYNLIWRIGTAKKRKVQHYVILKDWQSKTRDEIFFFERNKKPIGDGFLIREHWEYKMDISSLETNYPYLEFFALPSDENEEDENNDKHLFENPSLTLLNGDIVEGIDCSSELFMYTMGVRINEVGKEMLEWVINLNEIGLIEINPEKMEIISIAPWHQRQI